jgi:hypothetical protein
VEEAERRNRRGHIRSIKTGRTALGVEGTRVPVMDARLCCGFIKGSSHVQVLGQEG